MEEKLRAYVYACFEDAPKDARTIEVRDEICANVLERYHDLLRSGATPEEAYDIARRSVGNVQEILDGLQEAPTFAALADTNTKRRGAYIGTGVALYIIGPGLLIGCSALGSSMLGLVLMFAAIAVATGLCVYGSTVYPKVPTAAAHCMSAEEAEEYQQWRAEKYDRDRRKKRYSGILWPLICATYFIVSFTTGAWYITWVIFIIGAALDKLVEIAAD